MKDMICTFLILIAYNIVLTDGFYEYGKYGKHFSKVDEHHEPTIYHYNNTVHIITGKNKGLTHADTNHTHAIAIVRNGGHTHAEVHREHGSFAHAETLNMKHGTLTHTLLHKDMIYKRTHHYKKKRSILINSLRKMFMSKQIE